MTFGGKLCWPWFFKVSTYSVPLFTHSALAKWSWLMVASFSVVRWNERLSGQPVSFHEFTSRLIIGIYLASKSDSIVAIGDIPGFIMAQRKSTHSIEKMRYRRQACCNFTNVLYWFHTTAYILQGTSGTRSRGTGSGTGTNPTGSGPNHWNHNWYSLS